MKKKLFNYAIVMSLLMGGNVVNAYENHTEEAGDDTVNIKHSLIEEEIEEEGSISGEDDFVDNVEVSSIIEEEIEEEGSISGEDDFADNVEVSSIEDVGEEE